MHIYALYSINLLASFASLGFSVDFSFFCSLFYPSCCCSCCCAAFITSIGPSILLHTHTRIHAHTDVAATPTVPVICLSLRHIQVLQVCVYVWCVCVRCMCVFAMCILLANFFQYFMVSLSRNMSKKKKELRYGGVLRIYSFIDTAKRKAKHKKFSKIYRFFPHFNYYAWEAHTHLPIPCHWLFLLPP